MKTIVSTSRIRLYQISFFAAVLLVWVFVTETGRVSPLFLPKLPALGRKFIDLLTSGDWARPLSVTLFELASAYAMAVVAGVFIGFLVSRTRFATRVFEPLFSSLFAIPLIIFYPLAMLFFGLGPGPRSRLGRSSRSSPSCSIRSAASVR